MISIQCQMDRFCLLSNNSFTHASRMTCSDFCLADFRCLFPAYRHFVVVIIVDNVVVAIFVVVLLLFLLWSQI